MSDQKNGEPVEETTSGDAAPHVDDVVSRANAGLADAEAASRDAVAPEPAIVQPVEPEPHAADEPRADAADAGAASEGRAPIVESAASGESPTVAAPVVTERSSTEPAVRTHEPEHTHEPAYTGTSGDLDPAIYGAGAGVAGATAVTASEPAAPVAPSPQPIFVQAPEAPRPRGNRGAAAAIGLLAALSFGLLYLVAALIVRVVDGDATAATLGTDALAAVASWWFWVPVVVFFVAFWLLGAIINRGRWGAWVIFGLLVGLAAYGGHLLGQLFQAQFWTLTAREGADLVAGQLFAPLAIVAFILGREITIWFGAWAAARGKRVTELNVEARREYERTLEAGPQLHRM